MIIIKVSAGIVILIIIVLSLVYLLSNHEKNSITPAIRAITQGTYVTLSDGVTHYQIHGTDSGQTVVLIRTYAFNPEFEPFYRKFGFYIFRAGIIDRDTMK